NSSSAGSPMAHGAEAAEILLRRPIGAKQWLTCAGRSMFPLLLAGDRLRVIRSEQADLRLGDVAVIRRADGVFFAHMVIATEPLTTSSFAGVTDTPGGDLLGYVDRIERWGRQIPLPRGAATGLYALHRAAKFTYGLAPARALWRLTRRLL